jgi:hypothetical protein
MPRRQVGLRAATLQQKYDAMLIMDATKAIIQMTIMLAVIHYEEVEAPNLTVCIQMQILSLLNTVPFCCHLVSHL